MIVTGLVVLYLSSALGLYTAGRTPSAPAHVQQPQPAHPSKSPRIFIEEDFSTAQMLRRELTDWSGIIGIPIIFVEKDTEAYDLRILLTSGVGSDSDSCNPPFAPGASSSCRVTITLHFVSALALAPDGKLQFTETGVGSAKISSITPLARKLAKRLSVLPYAKSTPAK
jgi:hypothetical protein